MEAPATTTQSSNNTNANNGGGGEGNNEGGCCWRRLRSAPAWLWRSAVRFAEKVAQIARDDTRRVAHSFKVGLALTLVSVVYYVTPLFNGFGGSAMWAVLTIVIVMEFTVGATLSKGLNRALATLVASSLAIGAHELASLIVPGSEQAESILLIVFVFFVASAATFSRFIPEIKARYDYGVSIFILTFSLVAVSSYRVEELRPLAVQRTATIFVGVAICLLTTVLVFPVWAGDDLHNLAAGNLDKLADFLQGMESECFGENARSANLEGKGFLHAYKSVLSSKDKEDSLCALAKWEPFHGKFRFRHPWSQYQKLGTLCRQCASTMEALSSYVIILTKSQVIANATIS
ncbi:Aluminum-activated malate transporter 1 [Dichanthelium oligosanthes]|uniref:Aluminum-activated malate transporter 1 n=1 Tax=Dichanthelium oligosanthes TaxID=888268 RepID=A0A1E5UJH3_9POAL|nr:Aluminum-activated malate transporter 1 [Dichanthelium oligosanthes]